MTKVFRRCAPAMGVLLLAAIPAGGAIRYEVSVARPAEHIFRVTMSVPEVRGELTVQMPAWNALYQIRDFAFRVQDVQALDAAGRRLPVVKRDKQTWSTRTAEEFATVTVKYAVFWDEGGPFSTQLNSSHAFINLAGILMYVPSRRGEESSVTFTDMPAGWRAGTALKPGPAPFAYVAANYDALVDSPVELGEFEEFRVEAQGSAGPVRLRVVVHSEKPLEAAAREGMQDTLRRLAAYQTSLMREVPFDEYLFLYHFGPGGGGMEHSYSTAIHTSSPETMAGVSAHEFFHLWNVKRIRPMNLEPPDYTQENWTRSLWFAEGVTSTYADFTLVRSGVWSAWQWYASLAGEIAALESRPARAWKSVEEASLDAWFEKYALYRRPTLSISYYNKGQILGVLLDILIRDATDNRRSLDDVMRYLNEQFARRRRFYDETSDLRAAVERVAGKSFAAFFEKYVAGTEELPCDDTLALAGLKLERKSGRDYVISEDEAAGSRQKRIREGLLRGETQ